MHVARYFITVDGSEKCNGNGHLASSLAVQARSEVQLYTDNRRNFDRAKTRKTFRMKGEIFFHALRRRNKFAKKNFQSEFFIWKKNKNNGELEKMELEVE